MSTRPKCTRCSMPIMGIIKIDASRKKIGKKSIHESNCYDEDCYYMLNQERALNEFKKERANKKTNKK